MPKGSVSSTCVIGIDVGELGDGELTVDYRYTPATKDVMYLPNGDPGYPGDPAELEILRAWVKCNNAERECMAWLEGNEHIRDAIFNQVVSDYED